MSKKNKQALLSKALYKEISPKTNNQVDYFRCMAENTVTICHGPSGSGKSICAIGLAVEYFFSNKIDNILISRSIIGCDNDIGILPGDIESKVSVYMQPYLEYLHEFIPNRDSLYNLIHSKAIVLDPVEVLRGRTYHNTFMILDEAQNCTPRQLKMFMTRIGNNSKLVVIGDNRQSDIRNNGLHFLLNKVNDTHKDIAISELTNQDILRSGIIKDIIEIFESGGVY